MAEPRRRRKADLQVGQAWRDFYASTEGRKALASFFAWCNVYSPIDEHDPIRLAKAEGERSAALRIIELMNLKPEDFPQQAEGDIRILNRMMGIE